MEKNLLEILACPICKGELIFELTHQELICKFDRLAYPVIEGIPVMLESRARRWNIEESGDEI
ncbi:MAG: hypothetical protein K0S27_1319 [Gammaproteobacteria bacterium]|nr:hypothetical protein [Gammaproteobacteria bacterium]